MKQIPFGRPIIGKEEKQAVCDVLDSGMLVHGKRIEEFESAFAAFTGAPHAVGVSSCTAGLHLVYFHLGLGPGDEVIVPAQTHTATAHAVEYVGAKPVFVDAEPRTGNINVAQIEAAVTPNTRAISVVHFLGRPVDMPPLVELARKHDLTLVEDCALSLGGRVGGVHTGLLGDVGVFSFYPVKHMTTAEGGMVITRHEELAAALHRKRAFGIDRHVGERKIPGQYDVQQLGFNYRMSELHAVLGVLQLRRVPGFLDARRRNYEALAGGLAPIEGLTVLESASDGEVESSYYCLSIVLEDELAPRRLEIIRAIREGGVGTSIYYPCPVPLMTYYREKYGYREGQFPVAERISGQGIALPVGPHIEPGDVPHMVDTVRAAVENG